MVQGRQFAGTTRLKLIGLLPRLRRFAAVLAGDRLSSDELLREACRKMLGGEADARMSAPFDVWAFTELYGTWLEKLRDHTDPMAQGRGDEQLFIDAFAGADTGAGAVVEIAAFLSKLPPQQRSAILLIYGDGFSYEDAAAILDAPRHTVVERAARALSTLVERSGLMTGSAGDGATIEALYPAERQAG